MNKLCAVLALAMCLVAPACAAPAPPVAAPFSGFSRIPKTDPIYKDMATLIDAGFVGDKNWPFVRNNGMGPRPGDITPYEFSCGIVMLLADTQKAATYDQILRDRPKVRAAFERIFDRMEPTILLFRDVDVHADKERLASLEPAFADVPPTHWAYQSVETLRTAGIIVGYPARTYQIGQ